MRVHIPPGTTVSLFYSRVTLDFMMPEDASKFCEFLKWLDDKENDGQEMVLKHDAEPVQ